MTPKASQLFLELYLLRLRYTDAEIKQASNVLEVMNDPGLNNLMVALKQLQVNSPIAKSRGKTLKGSSKTSRGSFGHSYGGIPKAITYFVERVAKKRILPTQEQLDGFARTLGVTEIFRDRQEVARAIKQNLESMPTKLALELMRSVDSQSKSDSDAYVNLAKTLMRN